MPAVRWRLCTLALVAMFLAPVLAAAQIAKKTRDPNAQPIAQDPSLPRRLEALPPPPPGPPPQGLRFDSQKTFGVFATIMWNPAPNATGYRVSRGKRDDATCCNSTSIPLDAATTSWTDVGLYKAGYYRYTVTVTYADGSVGQESVDLVLQHGAAPTVTVQDLGLARVRLEWHRGVVPGTCCVRIVGPGLGPTGEKFQLGGGPLDLPILPAGTHTWTVAAAYNVKNLPVQPSTNFGTYAAHGDNYVIVAPPSEWTTVSHTVSYGMGRFRISLEGFKALSVTAEDPFRHDGRGDEVFITTQVSEYGRNGSLKSTRSLRTPTFGDRHNYPARVQAGSASPQGGIVPNDHYPAPVQYVSQLQPPGSSNLPFLLWEGELTEIDNAVVLSPAIWESDEGDDLVAHYATFQTRIAPQVGNRQQVSPYIPNTYGRPVLDTWNPQRHCPTWISQQAQGCAYAFVPPIGRWFDEPIDMHQDRSHDPTYVAINWKLADSWTRVNPATVVEIPYRNRHTGWEYKLFIRIERMASAQPAVQVAPASATRRAAGR